MQDFSQKNIKVTLGELYSWAKEYQIDRQLGYQRVDDPEIKVYLSPQNLSLFLMYLIYTHCGMFHTATITNLSEAVDAEAAATAVFTGLDDASIVPEISLSEVVDTKDVVDTDADTDETESNLGIEPITLNMIKQELDRAHVYGIFIEGADVNVPDRITLVCDETLRLNGTAESICEYVSKWLLEFVKDRIDPAAAIDTLPQCGPVYVYLGKMPDYMTYRELNRKLGDLIGCTILYYNQVEYLESQELIATQDKQVLFERILAGIPSDQVYTFTEDNPFVKIFATVRQDSMGIWTTTNFESRKMNQRYFQVKEFLDWLSVQKYKVYMFSSNLYRYKLDDSFYAALALHQQNTGVKVLLNNSMAYDTMLTDFVMMEYADFFTRYRTVSGLYKPNTIRVLSNYYGRSEIAVIKSFNLNLKFTGINLAILPNYIKRDSNGRLAIVVDTNVVDFDEWDQNDILTTSRFETLSNSGFDLRCRNVLDALLSAYNNIEGTDKGADVVPREFEEFLYLVCRLLDQMLFHYSNFTTIRDLACFVASENNVPEHQRSGISYTYIGVGSMNPYVMCDVLVLSPEGILIQDQKYHGTVLDVNWVDDIKLAKFKKGISDDTELSFTEKIKHIYEQHDVFYDPRILDLSNSRLPAQKGLSLFMSTVYGAGYGIQMVSEQDVFELRQESIYSKTEVPPLMHTDKLTPIYFGLALPRNYKAYKYLFPYIKEYTTSFGFRQIPYSDSPLNIYGGLLVYGESNLWLFPELFQRHEPYKEVMEGGYEK